MAGQRGEVELAEVGGARCPGEARSLVEQAEHLCDRPAVRVGVDQQGGPAEQGGLGRQVDREGRPSGRAGRAPHGDQPTERTHPGSGTVGGPGSVELAESVGTAASIRGRHAVQSRLDGTGHRRDVGLGCHESVDAQLTQSTLALFVVTGHHTDYRNAGRRHPAQDLAVEAAEIGREEHGPAVPGCDGGQQVGYVDAASHHGHTAAPGIESGDEPGLPLRTRDGREDRDGHCGVTGTRAR